MVPLSALVSTRYVIGPDLVTRFNDFPAIAINGSPGPRASAPAQALAAIQAVAKEVLPVGLRLRLGRRGPRGGSSGSTSAIAFVFGLIMVFLILAAQYESWSLPVGVMMAVPFAIFGALRGHRAARHRQRHLLPDRAADPGRAGGQERHPDRRVRRGTEPQGGHVLFDAAVGGGAAAAPAHRHDLARLHARAACRWPSPPGASANSRHSIGTGVIGGMLAATVIAIFFIPLFYWALGTLSTRLFGSPKGDFLESVHDTLVGEPAAAPAGTEPETQTQARRGCLICAAPAMFYIQEPNGYAYDCKTAQYTQRYSAVPGHDTNNDCERHAPFLGCRKNSQQERYPSSYLCDSYYR